MTGSARRAPLEDSGGIHGYTDLRRTVADSTAENHEEVAGWVAGTSGPWAEPFDPEALDVERVNRALTRRFDPSGDDAQWGASLARMVPRMYPGSQVAFGSYLDAAQLARPVLFDAELAARSVRPVAWLLGLKRFGVAKDASVLLAAEPAVGGGLDRRELAGRIAYGLSALGWVEGDRWTPLSGESVRYLVAED